LDEIELDWADCLAVSDPYGLVMATRPLALGCPVTFTRESIVLEFTTRTITPDGRDLVKSRLAALGRVASRAITENAARFHEI